MTESTLQEMKDKWAAMMAARYDTNHPRAGQRVHDVDMNYQRECMALRVQIEQREAAEAPGPQINAEQLRQINEQSKWLERYKGVRTADGRQLYFEPSQEATAFRARINKAQQMLAAGTPLDPAWIEDAEARLENHKATLGAEAVDQSAIVKARVANHMGGLLPPSGATQLGGGAIITKRDPING